MTTNQTSRDYFKTLNILYFALISGQVIFAIIILFLYLYGIVQDQPSEMKQIFFVILPLFAIAGIYASQYVFKLKLKETNNKTVLPEKLTDYRSACIVRWAILEAPSFLAILAAFITGEIIFLVISVIIIVWFYSIKPGVKRTITELELDYNDKILLEDPNSFMQ